MHETGKQLFNLMFRPGETICVSHNMYGYHSLPLENVLNDKEVTLLPTQDSAHKRHMKWEDCIEHIDTDKLLLVALNPIQGLREDMNAMAFRNFLVELDYGSLTEQIEYIKSRGMPYSALVFSGNKSVHCLISLDKNLPNYDIYYTFAEWILAIVTMADPNTKNPSRCIRIPGAERDPGKFQELLQIKGHVTHEELVTWLNLHEDAKPKKEERNKDEDALALFDISFLKPWVAHRLQYGLDPTKGRNKQWFSIACEFALAGYTEDATMSILSNYFVPDRDFREKEWKTSIRSAFKYIYDERR